MHRLPFLFASLRPPGASTPILGHGGHPHRLFRRPFHRLRGAHLPACTQAPCAAACPTGAYSQRRGGGVIVRKNLCIRCGECFRACPVDAIYLDPTGDPFVCLHCGKCVPYCPHDCLEMKMWGGGKGEGEKGGEGRGGGGGGAVAARLRKPKPRRWRHDSGLFRVLVVDLATGKGKVANVPGRDEVAGGSGLGALLFTKYGKADRPWDDPEQPVIFAIGPLTGYFPLMSKTVAAFKSPYHDQYAESHAGGRSALALKFADLVALVVTGRAPSPSALVVGSRYLEMKEVHYLWGLDIQETGKLLRRMFLGSGHRSILRIGPAGENKSAMAGINVDTYRHFGRLGGGAALGAKNLKAIVIIGDDSFPLMEGKDYPKLFLKRSIKKLTATDMMQKYHNLGTPVNVAILNEQKALPWRNLQATSDPNVHGITGERFAETALLRERGLCRLPGRLHPHRLFPGKVSDRLPLFLPAGIL